MPLKYTKGKRPTYSKNKVYRVRRKAATKTAAVVKQVVSRMAETKATIISGKEISTSSLTSPTTAQIVALNTLSQGSPASSRVGTKVTPKYLDVRGSVHLNADPTQVVKIMIIEHDIGSDPLSELLENNSGDLAPAGEDLSAIYARINTTKFKVLASRVMTLGQSIGYYGTKLFHMNVKLSGQMYYDHNEVIPHKRQISLIWFNRQAPNDETTGVNVEFTYNSKFYYQDL